MRRSIMSLGILLALCSCYRGQLEKGSDGGLRPINTAIVTYAQTYPKLGFPRKLSQLGPPMNGATADEQHSNMVDGVLASGVKSGYKIEYLPGAINEQGRIDSYVAISRPLKYGEDGKRSYYTDQSGVIRNTDEDRAPNDSDPKLK